MASRANFPGRIEKRKASAKARQESSDKLTNEQRLAKATVGSREYHRLVARTQK
jgi:hypothetical protein